MFMPHGHVVDGLGVGKNHQMSPFAIPEENPPPEASHVTVNAPWPSSSHNAVAIHRRIFCAKKEMVIYMEMVQNLKENYQISIDFMNFI